MALSGFAASRRARAWIALVCIGLMLIAVNIIAGRFLTARLDLTGERLYTLSRGGQRQAAPRGLRPAALLRYRGSRRRVRLAGGAARSAGRAGVLRARRHEL